MYKIFSVLEFLIITVFFICPSLFASYSGREVLLDFSHGYRLQTFMLFFVSLLVFYMERKVFMHESKLLKDRKTNFIIKAGSGTFCLGVLFLISAFCELLSFFLTSPLLKSESRIIFPRAVFYKLNFVTGTFLAAFTEEIFYRFYLPEGLKRNLSILSFERLNPKSSKVINLSLEVTAVLIFALMHRYLGFFAVVNAFFSGAVLRVCMKKTNSIMVPAVIHFIYNISVFTAVKVIFP